RVSHARPGLVVMVDGPGSAGGTCGARPEPEGLQGDQDRRGDDSHSPGSERHGPPRARRFALRASPIMPSARPLVWPCSVAADSTKAAIAWNTPPRTVRWWTNGAARRERIGSEVARP